MKQDYIKELVNDLYVFILGNKLETVLRGGNAIHREYQIHMILSDQDLVFFERKLKDLLIIPSVYKIMYNNSLKSNDRNTIVFFNEDTIDSQTVDMVINLKPKITSKLPN